MKLLRRVVPVVQESACSGCGTGIRERRRRPCRVCGSLNRVVVRSMDVTMGTRDEMG